ncbi:hypothetical protein LIER_11638 [Lithospermum erythrorhizon]|uniref:Uncharacterized protein n=1 Tax=Lithospermum erythrorhizon TaxID=34254 RepID=A0AAV3PNT7_LITER
MHHVEPEADTAQRGEGTRAEPDVITTQEDGGHSPTNLTSNQVNTSTQEAQANIKAKKSNNQKEKANSMPKCNLFQFRFRDENECRMMQTLKKSDRACKKIWPTYYEHANMHGNCRGQTVISDILRSRPTHFMGLTPRRASLQDLQDHMRFSPR